MRNLAPFSFFTVASVDPPVVCFSPLVRGDGRRKDTIHNLEQTGEFVLNIVSESFAPQMNATSAEVDADVDEWVLSGLTPLPSDLVQPPRVAESHVHLECRLRQIIRFGDNVLAGNLVLGDILIIDVNEDVLVTVDGQRLIDRDRLQAIGRMAGESYARTTDCFDLQRPAPR